MTRDPTSTPARRLAAYEGHGTARDRLLTASAVVLCLVALAARPVGYLGLTVTLMAGVLGVGLSVPGPRQGSGLWRWGEALVLGVLAVAVARGLSTAPPHPFGAAAAAAALAAAIAEEAFFRRLLFGWILPWGPAIAVLASSIAFAAVHVPAYGTGAVAVNLAAGLVLGWQRWATGGWSAPAATHTVANLLQMV